LSYRIIINVVKISPWDNNITFCADKVFISKKVITTCIAKPWKKEADKIIPKIVDITHAASRIIFKVRKNFADARRSLQTSSQKY
jgi:hypothetical protein